MKNAHKALVVALCAVCLLVAGASDIWADASFKIVFSAIRELMNPQKAKQMEVGFRVWDKR